MGTSMAFYNIQNKGFSEESLREGLSKINEEVSNRNAAIYEHHNSIGISPFSTTNRAHSAVIAFCETSKWLPMFEENLCEGYNAISKDTTRFSEIFGAPVIAFSLFDSDVLFVSYSDAEKGVAYDYERSNFGDEEDDDASEYGPYIPGYPEFLQALCKEDNRDRLRDIWASTEYVFADDKMADICDLLGMSVIYDGAEMPEGYAELYAD